MSPTHPRKQRVLANRQQNDCAELVASLTTSRIKFLPACEDAYDPTRLRDNIHHGLDSRWSLDHPPAASASAPAAAMVMVVVVVVMVVGWSTLFWRDAAIRTSGYLKHGETTATGPMSDERTCNTWFVPVLLRVMRCWERNGRRSLHGRRRRIIRRLSRRLLLGLLWRLLGQCGEDDARVGCISVLCLPLCTADRAADPFGRWRRRSVGGAGSGGSGVFIESNLDRKSVV